MDPLHVVTLCHAGAGGSSVAGSELAHALERAGHRSSLVARRTPPRLASLRTRVAVREWERDDWPLPGDARSDVGAVRAILQVAQEAPVDVLHAHYALPHALLAGLARDLLRAAGQPTPAVVLTVHGTDVAAARDDPAHRALLDAAVGGVDVVAAVSGALGDLLRELLAKEPPGGVQIVPNFVDPERFAPVASPGPDDPPHLVHVSNFRALKRVPALLRAFASAARGRRAELSLLGRGPEIEQARAVANDLGLGGRVHFLGDREPDAALLSRADLFGLASAQEAFGLAALEAMACGTPVVAPAVGGLPELLEGGEVGVLVPPDDDAALATAIAEHLFDRERCRELGERARAHVLERYRPEATVAAYAGLYARALARVRG